MYCSVFSSHSTDGHRISNDPFHFKTVFCSFSAQGAFLNPNHYKETSLSFFFVFGFIFLGPVSIVGPHTQTQFLSQHNAARFLSDKNIDMNKNSTSNEEQSNKTYVSARTFNMVWMQLLQPSAQLHFFGFWRSAPEQPATLLTPGPETEPETSPWGCVAAQKKTLPCLPCNYWPTTCFGGKPAPLPRSAVRSPR